MDETSLYGLRRTPPEGFARQLRAALQAQEDVSRARPRRLGMLVAIPVSCAFMVLALAVPSVRATARAFLDLFRVVNFVPVPVDPATLRRLHDDALDLPHLISEEVQVLQKPAAPVAYSTPTAAGTAAGLHVYLPAWMPVGWDTGTPAIEVLGGSSARINPDIARLEQLLNSLDIHDISIPPGLQGQSATVSIPPIVVVRWQHGEQQLELLQAHDPQLHLPAGIAPATLGEIGLRILGLSPSEAARFAQSIDWRTTLLVPVPANAASFTQVTVGEASGLLIEPAANGSHHQLHAGAVVLWSAGDQVFALRGTVRPSELVEMAQTMQ